MPRYCQAKAAEFSDSQIVKEILERTCEFVIPFLGINPGSHDRNYYFGAFGDIMKTFLNPGSCSFQVLLLLAASFLSFLIGVYIRRSTILCLLRQKEEWIDKEKMLLNQLWAALEEKLENKAMLQEARAALEKVKVESSAERAEKESMQARMWGLDRNVKILQCERDALEEKLRDCVKTFGNLRHTISQNIGQGETGSHVDSCMDKIKGLQTLMQKLIEAHRQEHVNFVTMLEKQPCI